MTSAVAPADSAVSDADVVAHRGLVFLVVSRLKQTASRRGLTEEDLVALGMTGVWRGLRTFDPARSALSTHLSNCATWEILGEMRRSKLMKQMPLDGEGMAFEVPARDEPCQVEGEEEQAKRVSLVADLVRMLPGQLRRAAELRFGLLDGRARTLVEVGESLGVSSARAGQLIGKGIARLRREMERRGLRGVRAAAELAGVG